MIGLTDLNSERILNSKMNIWFWHCANLGSISALVCLSDLRDDKQFFANHPGASAITTAQVIIYLLNGEKNVTLTSIFLPVEGYGY